MATDSILTPPFRVAFPQVFEPKASQPGQEEKYSINMLFPKGTDLSVLKELARKACEEKWGSDKNKWPKNMRNPFRDADEENVAWDGFEGTIFVRASSKFQPGAAKRVRENGKLVVKPITDPQEIYGGCWCAAQVNAWAYDTQGNKGVSFGIQNVLKLKDDEAFGGGRQKAEDAFGAYEGAADMAVDGNGEAPAASGGDSWL